MSYELSWAAGFFDGEGYSYAQKSAKRSFLSLSVSQVDPRPLHRFWEAVGVGKVYGPYRKAANPNWKHQYMYRATGDSAIAVMELLWPYLSEPKKEQAEKSGFEKSCEKMGEQCPA